MKDSNVKTNERWGLIISLIQALATVGMLIVAIIGIQKVAPIITYQTYQIEQKQQEELELKGELEQKDAKVTDALKYNTSTDRFINDVLGWWTNQVENYQKILDAIENKDKQKLNISFKVVGAQSDSSGSVNSPDFLFVNISDPAGKKKMIKVAVNERAMNPNQYIQCKINQGLLYDMIEPDRKKVEIAINRYIHEGMVNKVPPAYVQSDISLKKLHDVISYNQPQRVEAIQQIKALQGVISDALN